MPQIDKYSLHEALHMSCFLMESVDRELMEHKQIRNNTHWAELAGKAHQALFDLYQSIGQASYEDDE